MRLWHHGHSSRSQLGPAHVGVPEMREQLASPTQSHNPGPWRERQDLVRPLASPILRLIVERFRPSFMDEQRCLVCWEVQRVPHARSCQIDAIENVREFPYELYTHKNAVHRAGRAWGAAIE